MATTLEPSLTVSKDEVKSILDSITSDGQNMLAHNDTVSREKLVNQARALVTALESPLESIFRIILAEPSRMAASRLALDLKIFDTLGEDGGRPKSISELAAPSGASPTLVGRLARHLTAMGMMDQTGPEEFTQNRLAKILAYPKYRQGIRYTFDGAGRSFSHMPEYFSNTKFENPENTDDGPFQYAHNTPNHWVWIEQRPQVMQAFQDYLHGVREDQPNFMEEGFYPVHDRLIKDVKFDGSSASAFIDVGGGAGHGLDEFAAQVPDWRGRLVLQEQEQVVQIAKSDESLNPRIEANVHDFFTPQPIQGARAYYMRYILHDWPDDRCRTILRHLKAAMTPGYSKILIHECVVADQGASWQHTALDLYMMALFATKERTEREWRALLESEGLKVTGIWSKGKSNLSLIEAMI